MLARASAPIERDEQAVLFYLYADDLAASRDHLLAPGVTVGEIRDGSPGAGAQIGLADPDGWCLGGAEIE
ncbi:MAG: hypothetical protein ACJ76Z_09370 [Thermoleophilaceae bacterium]